MAHPTSTGLGSRFLDAIEWIGNKLPDPVFIFLGCAVLVMVLSAVGSGLGWKVAVVKPTVMTQPVLDEAGAPVLAADGAPRTTIMKDETGRPRVELVETGESLSPRSLLSSDGAYWALTNMVGNFTRFAPLGLILVCMLGIGVAEHVGLFGAILKWLGTVVPSAFLTPMIVFLGIMANIASDAGYLVLPPLAAALYVAFGRSPLAGIAAAFSGIAAGFSANLLVAASDAIMAGLTQPAAQILDPAYTVNPTCNWGFMAGSTVLLTLLGWGVTAWIVEPRLKRLPADQGGPAPASAAELRAQELSPGERRAVRWAIVAELIALGTVFALIYFPGAPLHGVVNADDPKSPARWAGAVVPIIFFTFLMPGLAYGFSIGALRSQKDIAKAMIQSMASMAAVITLYFFAAQFIEYLNYSNLGRMLAFTGGTALVEAKLPGPVLLAAVVLLSLTVNMFVGSMSAKWTMLAPILVPMLMMVQISPELTQVAYRVGDSVTNIVTPLNPYLIIILVAMQRYAKNAGMGNLIALMAPYSVVFGVVWTLFLVAWVYLGIPLGPAGPLHYVPPQ
ncbi:MAG: AbgT family transporter [Phycisphaerae bacterium]|nr:AbgT family transporter [Phycisphaerae bacterium]